MQAVSIFKLASQQAEWLAVRQKSVATNIANVNTNGFKPTDVLPFKEVLGAQVGRAKKTHINHIELANNSDGFSAVERQKVSSFGEGVKISLPNELIDAGEIRRSYELNTAIVKSFHRMIIMTVRG